MWCLYMYPCACYYAHMAITYIVQAYSVLLHYRFQLKSLKNCKDDVKQIAECFMKIWREAEGSKIYSDYCTKYPKLVLSSIIILTQ